MVFSPIFANAFANLLVATAPFLITVRAPITIVVINLSGAKGAAGWLLKKKKTKFGPLLGFPPNTIIPKNTKSKSPFMVDVNRGLRYITIGCNCVNTDRNFDMKGNPSRVFARIPVTTEQSLNESVTSYDNIHTSVSVLNGDHSMFEFDVSTNIGYGVGLTVMFELYIE